MAAPSSPPPSYNAATSSSSSSQPQPPSTQPPPTTTQTPPGPNHLKTRSTIPPAYRRSMEDESRPLPPNWVRQYDPQTHHQFYVDSSVSPPRSIWQHPYDDSTYLSSLSPSERTRIQGLHRTPSEADIEAESSDDDPHPHQNNHTGQGNGNGGEQIGGVHKFGRKMKDKMTGSTHVEREKRRREREAQEQKTYEQHQHIRQQMSKAMQTGEPQLVGKDKDGKEVWIEPPSNDGYGGGFGGGGLGMGGGLGGMGGYGGGGYGYNPYSQGVYGNPNQRYIRPQGPYSRPYGMGYGGGYGLPLAAGLGGGMMLGGLLF